MIQNIQQQRAQHALQKIRAWKQNPNYSEKKFRSYASNLPSMVITNGLGQAAAFCLTKSEAEYKALYDLLSNWLITQRKVFGNAAPSELIDAITQADMQTYQNAQTEALLYLDWVKKLVKGLMQDED